MNSHNMTLKCDGGYGARSLAPDCPKGRRGNMDAYQFGHIDSQCATLFFA